MSETVAPIPENWVPPEEDAEAGLQSSFVRQFEQAEYDDWPMEVPFGSEKMRTFALHRQEAGFIHMHMDSMVRSIVEGSRAELSAEGARPQPYGGTRGIALNPESPTVVVDGSGRVDRTKIRSGDVLYVGTDDETSEKMMLMALDVARQLKDEHTRGVVIGLTSYLSYKALSESSKVASLLHGLWAYGYDGSAEAKRYYDELLQDGNPRALGHELLKATDSLRREFTKSYMHMAPAMYDGTAQPGLYEHYVPPVMDDFDVRRVVDAHQGMVTANQLAALNVLMCEEHFNVATAYQYLWASVPRHEMHAYFYTDDSGREVIDVNKMFEDMADQMVTDPDTLKVRPLILVAADRMAAINSLAKLHMVDDLTASLVGEPGAAFRVMDELTKRFSLNLEFYSDEEWTKLARKRLIPAFSTDDEVMLRLAKGLEPRLRSELRQG